MTGLQRDNFRILIDKKPVDIVGVREEDVPLSVGILVDLSASAVEPGGERKIRVLIDSLQQALRTFMRIGNKSNEYFLLAFNDKPQLLLDWTSDTKPILDSLDQLRPKGATALYDACYVAIDMVQHGRHPKHVLILISDGVDNKSTYFLKQVRQVLRESDVLLYAVNFSNEIRGTAFEVSSDQILNEFASISGGAWFSRKEGVALKVSDAAAIFEIIATELRRQYTVAITPQFQNTDSKWHKIKVKVNPTAGGPRETNGLSVRTREGFYVNHR